MTHVQRAYSLYELLITLGIFALVLTLGMPSLGNIVANHRIRAEVGTLFHAIHLARKESVVRRRVVTICPTRDGYECEESLDWSMGWMMFVNHSRNSERRRDEDEPILVRSGVDGGVRISSNRQRFSLRSTELRATNGTLVVCDPEKRAMARALVVSYTGRPRVALTDSRGQPYQCAH